MTESSLRLVPPPDTLAIFLISSFTATPVSSVLKFWATQLDLPAELSFAPYGQVFQELQRHGRGARPAAEAVAVLLRMDDFIPTGRHDGAASVADDLTATLAAAAQRSPGTTFLLAVCPPSSAVRNDPRRLQSVDEATQALRHQVSTVANVAYVESDDVIRRYRVSQAEDTYADKLGKIPYTPEYFAALGTALMRRLHRALTAEPKVLVVDGDNTLWDGILGEDGPAGVRVGLARQEVQEYLLEQRRAGRLLCLCSKNDIADVKEALAAVPGMRLKLDDFVHMRANWLPKSTNVLDLANDLDLASDSFVFIDDSPLECAEVRMQCPDVVVLHLPSDASRALQTLRHFWPLDIEEVTGEATQRTAFYHQEQRRLELRQHWTQSLPEFIDSLELEVTIRPAETTDHARMVDLMRRTTQFNLTGERCSAAEIEALPDSTEQLVVEVQDRFGSYGTVGLMMFSIADGSLTVTTLLLSCRALARGVEHRMLAHLGQVAVTQGLNKVRLRYVATARNLPGRQFLDEVAVPQDDTTDASVLYVVGAKDAANLRYNPDLTPAAGPVPAVADPETSRRSAGGARPKSWAEFGDIAAELTTAKSIRRAIRGAVYDGVGDHDDRTDDERIVSTIWAEILQVAPGHMDDDFRSLGGDSLGIVQLLASVYEEFRVEIPVDLLLDNRFTASNVVAMIRLLRTSGSGSVEREIPWVE